MGTWTYNRWRVPGGDIFVPGTRPWSPYWEVPTAFWRRFVPAGHFRYEHSFPFWLSTYTTQWRSAFTLKNKWRIDWHNYPPGLSPKNRWHTIVFPDQQWARSKNTLFRPPANRALGFWAEDTAPYKATWEAPSEMSDVVLFDERTQDVLGRYTPIKTEAYLNNLVASHSFWWGSWRVYVNPRKGLSRLAHLDEGTSSHPLAYACGWGGPTPHPLWWSDAWAAPVVGARRDAIGPLGPFSPHPAPFRAHLAAPLHDPLPPTYVHRPCLVPEDRRGVGLDPSSLPWEVQALLRKLDLQTRGGTGASALGWAGLPLLRALGNGGWGATYSWGGVLALRPQAFLGSHLSSWAPDFTSPLGFRHVTVVDRGRSRR